MRTGKPYPIRAFVAFGNNTLVSYAGTKLVKKALLNLDFHVAVDLFMTPSAELADIVLPAAAWPELDQVVEAPFAAANTVLAQQKVVQTGECRPDEEIIAELARRMGLEVATEPVDALIEERLQKGLGISFAELKERGHVTKPVTYRRHEQRGKFLTGSGKVELDCGRLRALGRETMPRYREPPEGPLSTPELLEDYPLILITGSRSRYFFLSEHRQLPTLRKAHPDPRVEIHPDIARGLGIADGDWVEIATKRGKIQQRALVTDGIDPRVVHADAGWWFPEDVDPEHGVLRSNANVLTNGGPPYDPNMGTYQLRALLCRVTKVTTKGKAKVRGA
jgi:anaerobic selenocysteine-containing dehydrogenase